MPDLSGYVAVALLAYAFGCFIAWRPPMRPGSRYARRRTLAIDVLEMRVDWEEVEVSGSRPHELYRLGEPDAE